MLPAYPTLDLVLDGRTEAYDGPALLGLLLEGGVTFQQASLAIEALEAGLAARVRLWSFPGLAEAQAALRAAGIETALPAPPRPADALTAR